MAKTIVKTSGFRELDKALSELPKATARTTLRKAGIEALKPMQAAAKAKVPVDTGKLQQSIIIKPGFDPKFNEQAAALFRATGSARGVKREKGVMKIGLGPSGRMRRTRKGKPTGIRVYAQVQEFGSVDQPAQPYMRPAWIEQQMAVLDHLKDSLAAAIDKSVKRIAKKKAKLGG